MLKYTYKVYKFWKLLCSMLDVIRQLLSTRHELVLILLVYSLTSWLYHTYVLYICRSHSDYN
jgi:hypothetical protein